MFVITYLIFDYFIFVIMSGVTFRIFKKFKRSSFRVVSGRKEVGNFESLPIIITKKYKIPSYFQNNRGKIKNNYEK